MQDARTTSWRIRIAWAAALACLAAPAVAGAQRLPLGDGRVADHPAVGYVYACRSVFRAGAPHSGPWIDGRTWDPAAKPHVSGRVFWPTAAFTLDSGESGLLSFDGNGLPVRQPTGTFPIARTEPVFRYDPNPNRIGAQDLEFDIPASPVVVSQPGCLPMGMIGFTTTGVALYNAIDDAGRDAAAHEIQDLCDGHPQANSQYHYHSGSSCIPGVEHNALVGWALDGHPILGMKDRDGRVLTNADLDACHGRREKVEVDGRSYSYVYRVTREYPYTVGCFMGRLLDSTLDDVRDGLLPRRRGRGRRGGGM